MERISANTTKHINLIVAIDDKWGISKQGKIPWKIIEDINFFRDITSTVSHKDTHKYTHKKNAVIMGKNTWLSLNGNTLKNRVTVIVSSTLFSITNPTFNFTDSNTDHPHVFVRSFDDAIEYCKNTENINDIFICGGSNIYKEALCGNLHINNFYISMTKKDYQCDNYFPASYFRKETTTDYCKSFMVKDINDGTKVEIIFCKYNFDLGVELIPFTTEGVPDRVILPQNNNEEKDYLNLLNLIINFGSLKQTRNARTLSTFGKQLSFNLSKGFPLLTTKRVFFRGIVEELLFFLKGDTNSNHLTEIGVCIWEDNTKREFLDSVGLNRYEVGDMGNMYGFNLLHFGAEYKGMNEDYTGKGFNQIEYCINLLKKDPFSRRIMMTTYNPSTAKQGCLYPCHGISILFNVDLSNNDTYALSCLMTQRSADMFLGIPFNIASYALLIHIICETINNDETYTGKRYTPGTLIMSLGDAHIYLQHYTETIRQILREPYPFPQLKINKKITSVTDFKYNDLELVNYIHHPTIKAKMVA